MDYFEDTYCETPVYYQNENAFQSECKGEIHCAIDFYIFGDSDFAACEDQYSGSRDVLDINDFALFFEFECDIKDVELYYFGEVPRNRLSNIVIACDALICLIFAVNIVWLGRSITAEQYNENVQFV